MGRKRKHSEAEVEVPLRRDEGTPQRPKRTLFGWKDKIEVKESDSKAFRNKEKVLVTCSRRISYRKGKDLYLWMAKCPNGPSVKFLVNAGFVTVLPK
ncbi:hypothetical protein U1Q18_033663 [Sarracenia purpurea var. burkii]